MELPALETWWPLLVILVIWLLYLFATWDHNYWQKKGVPTIKPLPIFGNHIDSMLLRKTIGDVYGEFYKKFEAYKYGGVYGMGKPALLLRDPELIKDVLVKEFTNFHDNEIFVDPDVDPMIGRNPFILRGERWKVSRQRLMPAFTVVKLKPLFPLIQGMCENMKQLILSESSGEFEAKELCARFTTDVVAMCAYGVEGNSLKDPESEFRQMGRAIISPDLLTNLKFMIAFLAPGLSRLLRWRFITMKVENFFMDLVKNVVKYRTEKNVTRNDYMQHLINVKTKVESEPSEKYPFGVVDVAAGLTTFFLDGFETSAGAMSFTLYCLAVYPEVQSKAREEVLNVMSENGGELSYDNIQKLTYLDMVFSETLRLYPPVLFMKKICTKKTKMVAPSGEGEITIEEETPMIIPVYSLHRDPNYFPDPEEFIPERFTEENKKERHKYVYLPFGEGPRTCLGMRFAHMQVKAGLASILTAFEIKTTDRTPIPMVPDPKAFILASKDGLWIQFVPLKK